MNATRAGTQTSDTDPMSMSRAMFTSPAPNNSSITAQTVVKPIMPNPTIPITCEAIPRSPSSCLSRSVFAIRPSIFSRSRALKRSPASNSSLTNILIRSISPFWKSGVLIVTEFGERSSSSHNGFGSSVSVLRSTSRTKQSVSVILAGK